MSPNTDFDECSSLLQYLTIKNKTQQDDTDSNQQMSTDVYPDE